MIASVLFHGDMLSQNVQPTSQKGEYHLHKYDIDSCMPTIDIIFYKQKIKNPK
jgi:hypothetical protein